MTVVLIVIVTCFAQQLNFHRNPNPDHNPMPVSRVQQAALSSEQRVQQQQQQQTAQTAQTKQAQQAQQTQQQQPTRGKR